MNKKVKTYAQWQDPSENQSYEVVRLLPSPGLLINVAVESYLPSFCLSHISLNVLVVYIPVSHSG